MGLYKLTAGDGYTYLTRQVAAHDSTEKGAASLGDYYAEKGESPGQWVGAGLVGLGMEPGQAVTETQMESLFGTGRHPDADRLAAMVTARGGSSGAALVAGALGRAFNVYDASAVFQVQVARQFTAYNTRRGAAWNAPIPVEQRASIRTTVATRMFAEENSRAPQDARELSGFIARSSRQATTAVAGYDLTFSPVKSVSTLWALAPTHVAQQIRAAHDAAVAHTLGWLESEAVFTRVGSGGARQVPVRGLVAAAFTHRDTRAGDPDLHTHVAISNKVQTQEGRWLALDGRVLYKANVAASERYNTRLEGELAARLGLRFLERETRPGLRPVREIAGVNSLLNRWWSSRRRDIEARRSVLAAQFQTDHGRPPTAVEALALAQQATLETRDAKHEPRSESEQRNAWRRQADDVLGGAIEVDEMVRDALSQRVETCRPTKDWATATATTVVGVMEESRATWQVWHLRAEAQRQARTAGIGLHDLDTAVDQVVNAAIGRSVRLGTPDSIREPDGLRRADGESVYEVHGATRYTSTRVLAAEKQLLATAQATGGRCTSEVRVGIAVAEEAANGVDLNDAQAAMVHQLATSGSRLQLALAPAGTGKTTTMRVLGRAWTDAGGTVIGLAPSAQAAQELGHAIEGHTDTLAKLTWTLTNAPTSQWPGWVQTMGPRTLVVIDEAGQAGTTELAAAVEFITGRGGVVRLVGDDQQLASVGAGGVLRDIAHTVGAITLSEVRRFTNPAEAAATLAVREGDVSALGYYADHGRIHVGDIGSVTDQAYDAWAADRAHGLDAILLAPTNELVTQLNTRARTDRLTSTGRSAGDATPGREVRLVDGTRTSAGDTIITRRNDRRLTTGRNGSDWVKNGDRWTVQSVHPDGSITAQGVHNRRRTVRLPAGYVSEQVQLGYASTVHAAQGMTTDTAHVVVTGEESRQLLYVSLSRGRAANHLYLANAHDGDPHSLIRPETLLPPTAIDTLTSILRRDGSQQSATTTRRHLDSPTTQLHDAVLRYHDALGYAAEQRLGNATLTGLEQQVEAIWPGLSSESAYPTLREHLCLTALAGSDPLTLLLDAAGERELGTAQDRAAVLDWRLAAVAGAGPLPWLHPVPNQLGTDRDWGPYLQARADRVVSLASQVRHDAATWSPANTPAWAAHLTASDDADLRGDVAVWRAAVAVPDTDIRPTGPRQPVAGASAHQTQLDHRIRAATGTTRSTASTRWADLLPACVTSDPAAARLRERLGSLDRAGVHVDGLLAAALSEPRPLPDEHAADALWWRMVGHLGPAAVRATGNTAASLRPSWTPALVEVLGQRTAERVMDDPAWPALVAAIHARPAGWTAEQLLTSATTQHSGSPDSPVPVDELCSALVWRVATMTDIPDEEDAPPGPHDVEGEPPTDLHALRQCDPGMPAPGTPVGRIVELNRAADDYYAQMYPRSWGPVYLTDRLGDDLTDDPRFTPGYAPPGPQSLIRHLINRGADQQELIDAGLARRTDRGNLVDAFRDRLIFPIHHGPDVVGFIGRRNPSKDESEYAGPKYLNSRTTAAFTKGEELFGLAEAAADLNAGAVPVLVEGPLDAIAVTLAAQGRAAGIAPLGTAFTDTQADRLRPYVREDPARVAIATDPDPAGWASAQRVFWKLAQHGADPQDVALPVGVDPADLLRTAGPEALTAALDTAEPFATTLTNSLIEQNRGDLDSPATWLRLVRQTGQIIGALPPDQWLQHIDRVTRELELPPGMLHLEVADAGTAWTNDPAQAVAQRLAELRTVHRPPAPTERGSTANTRVDTTPHMSAADHQLAARQRYALRPTAPTITQDEQELGFAPQVDPRHGPRR